MHRHAHRHAKYSRGLSLRHYLLALLASIAALITALSFTVSSSPAARAVTRAHAVRDRAAGSLSALAAREVPDKASLARSRHDALARWVAVHTYLVRSGDSISAVASRECGSARDWTGIYAASRARRWTARDANALSVGQHLYLACAFLPSQLKYASEPATVTVTTASHVSAAPARASDQDACTPGCPWGDGDGDGMDKASSPFQAQAGSSSDSEGADSASTPAASSTGSHSYAAASGTYHGSGSMQQCIISRESGGNSQVMNSSGHYGLYQFSEQTWAAHGGNPGDFGHASVAEQNQVYYSTVAADGYSDWTPYDGC